MGESQYTLFQPEFNRSIRVETRPERLSGQSGALLSREAWSRLKLDAFFEERLVDPRSQEDVEHPAGELLLTHLLLLAQGFGDQSDAGPLRDDPVLRLSVSTRRGAAALCDDPGSKQPAGLASQPTLSRHQRVLSGQRTVLREGLFQSAARRVRAMNGGHRKRYATLDVDSLPIEVHGQQEGSAYNGHYGCRCYHPVVASLGEEGDFLAVRLREGNAHTARGSLSFVLPLIERMERDLCQVASVRMDAGFPEDQILSALERRGTGYVARVRKNSRLETLAADFLQRQEAGPVPQDKPRVSYEELTYQADSWSRERRVVAVYDHRPGELFGNLFFLITDWSIEQMPPEALLALYRQRGEAEGHYGEFKSVLAPGLSSTRRTKGHYRGREPVERAEPVDPFAMNDTRLLLNALAYNLLHVQRTLLERQTRHGWSLQALCQWVLHEPARVLLHARQVTIVLSEAATRRWRHLSKALSRLRWHPPPQPA